MSRAPKLDDLTPLQFVIAAHMLVYTLDAGFLMVWYSLKALYHWLF